MLYLLWWFRRGSEVMSAEAALYLVEAERGIEVKVVAGLQAEEVGDEIRVALDQLKTAAELLFPVGHVTRTPSPLPVREAPSEMLRNEQVRSPSEG